MGVGMKSLILFASLLLVQAGQAKGLNIQQINQNIQKSGATWFAGKNHLTDKSMDELRRSMGLRLEGAEDIQFDSPESTLEIKSDLPPVLDWRNKDGKNWVSPIKDQANCGSCVAFASIGVLETQYKISSLFPDFNIKLSPQYLFACGGGACELGWLPSSAASFLKKWGAPDESCMPYNSGATGKDVACRESCNDVKDRRVKLADFETPTRGFKNIQAVKKALQHGPLVTAMKVHKDFVAYAGGIYKSTSKDTLGGHAISIVGYDDNKQAFIIRNSWGEEWGEKGFAYVSYDDNSGVGNLTWMYHIAPLMGAVSIQSPDSYTYFSETATLDAVSTYPTTDSIAVTVYDQQNQAVAHVNCPGKKCYQDISISGLKDGRYEVQAISLNNRGESIGSSIRHLFYVANQTPK